MSVKTVCPPVYRLSVRLSIRTVDLNIILCKNCIDLDDLFFSALFVKRMFISIQELPNTEMFILLSRQPCYRFDLLNLPQSIYPNTFDILVDILLVHFVTRSNSEVLLSGKPLLNHKYLIWNRRKGLVSYNLLVLVFGK